MLKLRAFIPVLIAAAGVWAYHNSFQGPFIFDDVPSIPANPHIRHLWPLSETMVVSPNLPVQGRPVECLTLAVNYALDGLNVRGYHALNLLIHLTSALVLFGLVRRTFAGEKLRDRFGAAASGLAAAIALLWEVHPLQTESVTYIVQRSELLMGLFLLLTVYCVLRGSQSPRARLWYVGAVVACAMGMGSKEVMVGAPLIVLLYDRVFLAPTFRDVWRRRAGMYVGLAVTWVWLTILVGRTVHPATSFGIQGLTPWNYLRTEAGVIVHYLRLCFWPRPLVLDYSDWPITLTLGDGLGACLVVAGLLVATVWAFRRRPWLGFLGAWFFLILAPTSSILPSAGEVAAERRMYAPSAAVVTLVVAAAYAVGKRYFRKSTGTTLGCIAVGAVALWFSLLTIQRNGDYLTEESIWQDNVDKRPGDARAHNNLGFALVQLGRVPEAIGHYEEAVRLKPDYGLAHYNFGNALMQQGRVAEATEQFEQTLQIEPDYGAAHYNLGLVLARQGRVPEAIEHYERALRLRSDYSDLGSYADIHNDLGLALVEQGRVPEAMDHYEEALQIQPDHAGAHYDLGLALAQQGRLPEAIHHWEETARLKPDFADVQYNLGIALSQLGRLPEAVGHYQQALQINPDFVEAHFDLGVALAKLGQTSEARAQYEQALKIRPDFAPAKQALAQMAVGGTAKP